MESLSMKIQEVLSSASDQEDRDTRGDGPLEE